MAQASKNIQRNFSAGLKTEFTGLNFPENAATDTENCIYTLIGDVIRRRGFDYETGYSLKAIDRTDSAITYYRWNNAGGDGNTQVLVLQVGINLYFYRISDATTSSPMSNTYFAIVNLTPYFTGGPSPITNECQFADGNGYLFVFNTGINPISCTLSGNVVTPKAIDVKIRDFQGYPDSLAYNERPGSLSNEHHYNLYNQGWPNGAINTFATDVGVYPSNADQWWRFKYTSAVTADTAADGNFNPGVMANKVVQPNAPAPKGSIIFNVRNFNRAASAGLPLIDTQTNTSFSTGTWFQGRVWYSGLNASTTTDPSDFFSWTENIYFSQIITDNSKFGYCYQVNDPTSEDFFDLLPTDGGVIHIPGCGTIHKLFPIHSGLLVFAANGIWFIAGSQGLGFTAADYTINKISAVQSISGTSFVDVLGLPVFWNEEGIYSVQPGRQGTGYDFGGLVVTNLCFGTILSFYAAIPLESKKVVKGVYNPLTYTIQWTYKSTDSTSMVDKYSFDKVLCLNTDNKSFYPYTLPFSTGDDPTIPTVHGVFFFQGPGGSTSPEPTLKYITSVVKGVYMFTFSEEINEDYIDWSKSAQPSDFTSYFVTGYNTRPSQQSVGMAFSKFQIEYIYIFSRNNVNTSYRIQSFWDYALTGNEGKASSMQLINNNKSVVNTAMVYRRHRLRGRGIALQIKVESVSGLPFDIMGWTLHESMRDGP